MYALIMTTMIINILNVLFIALGRKNLMIEKCVISTT